MAFLKLLKSYINWAVFVLVLGFGTNILALYVPKLSARVVNEASLLNASANGTGVIPPSLPILMIVALASFLIAVVQIYASTYFSEKVALDLRHKLIGKISNQTFGYISTSTPGRILTVATSDVNAVKDVVSQGLVTLLGAAVTLIGSAILLLTINVRLALWTLSVIPLLILTFIFIFGKISRLFRASQENLEKINALINESVIGAALVRVLHAGVTEIKNFKVVNERSREIGLGVVRNISALIPIIMLLANLTTIIIIWFGGNQVIGKTLSIGDFSAFLSYSAMFIWPLFVLSFVGTMISRGAVSLGRINAVLDAPVEIEKGEYSGEIKGDIEFKNVSLSFTDEAGTSREVLKNISFKIVAGSKNALVGPTAAGKTQIFYLLAGLVKPTSGEILIDGRPLASYKNEALLKQVGLVFQDSIIFNTTLRENISLSGDVKDAELMRALETAELDELVRVLPKGLDTLVSERGTTLSGGQKQRLMLARALASNPKVLLLDDFTARVDQKTERSILSNVVKKYPDVTLISITQKVEPIKDYEQIIVLMEGELVASGKHAKLLEDSFEYRQIFESQQSTENISSK